MLALSQLSKWNEPDALTCIIKPTWPADSTERIFEASLALPSLAHSTFGFNQYARLLLLGAFVHCMRALRIGGR